MGPLGNNRFDDVDICKDVTIGKDMERSYLHKPSTRWSQIDEYGQNHPLETTELIELGLSNIEKELRLIPSEKKTAWTTAQSLCPDLVGDNHKLLFLRCEVFDAAVSFLLALWLNT